MPPALVTSAPCETLVLLAGTRRSRQDDVAEDLVALLDGVTVVDGRVWDLAPGPPTTDPDVTLCITDARRMRRLRPGGAPVLSIGPRAARALTPVHGGTVVVCLDGSQRAEAALRPAARWAKALRADLLLVTVVPPATTQRLAALVPRYDLREDAALASAARHVDLEGVTVSWEVLHGTTAAALLSVIHRGDVRLVVLNSHGHSTPAGASLARLPGHLVRRSQVPILLTRCTAPPRGEVATGCRDRPPAARRRQAPVRPRTHPRVATRPGPVNDRGCRPAPPATRPAVDRRRAAGVAAAALALLCGLMAVVDLPYQATRGFTVTASELVAAGVGDPGGGALLVPYVQSERLDGWGVVGAWLDPETDVLPRVDGGDRRQHRELMTVAVKTARRLAGELAQPESALSVRVDTHGIGGPSAGLALTLQLIDDLTSGDLTGGHVVAVTGGVTAEGDVTPVGGLRFKARAARAGGAEVFLVPTDNYPEAASAGQGLRIVPVSTLAEALEIIERLAATGTP